jgi:hypothetical protein
VHVSDPSGIHQSGSPRQKHQQRTTNMPSKKPKNVAPTQSNTTISHPAKLESREMDTDSHETDADSSDTDTDPDEPQEVFRCEWGPCDLKFTLIKKLYEHVEVDHINRAKEKHWQCFWGICRTIHAQRSHIVGHMLTHVPYFPFKCDKCHKGFKRRSDLNKHSKRMTPCN